LAAKNPQKGQNPIEVATFCSADDLRYLPGIRRYLRLRTEPVFTGLEPEDGSDVVYKREFESPPVDSLESHFLAGDHVNIRLRPHRIDLASELPILIKWASSRPLVNTIDNDFFEKHGPISQAHPQSCTNLNPQMPL